MSSEVLGSCAEWQLVSIASAALEDYRVEARLMVNNLVDMERIFIPPGHFIDAAARRCVQEWCLGGLCGRLWRGWRGWDGGVGTGGCVSQLDALVGSVCVDAER